MEICDYGISGIYTVVEKREENGFVFFTEEREWDGFVLFTEGTAALYENGKLHSEVKKGDIVFFRRGDSYGFKASAPCSYITSGFFFEISDPSVLFPRVMPCPPGARDRIYRIAAEWEKRRPHSRMECKIELLSLYLGFICDLDASDGHRDSAVCAALDFLHDNFKRNFSASEIARHCSLSSSCLRARFLKATGMTITAYRDTLRLQAATELLTGGVFTIKETAMELGFCDVYHFSRFYKKHSGKTPGEARTTPLL